MLTLDEVAKSVKEATDAIKAANDSNKETIKTMVEETLKNVLRDHPGFTPERKIEFPGSALSHKDEVMASLPKELQLEQDKIYIMSKMLGRKPQELKSWGGFTRKMGDFKKALDVATAGEGAEWVPTGFSPELFGLVRLQLKVAALFPTIQMPTNPYKLPVQIGRFTSYKHSEQTADTSQTAISKGDPAAAFTGNCTFTAAVHAVEILASDELTEDSIVPVMPLIQNEIVQALAEGREDAILNGDTAASHEDTDISSAADRRKLWLGLRAMANDQSYTRDMATWTLGNLRLMRKDMGKYGVTPSQLAWVTGIAGYIKLLDLDEVTTVDKYGPGATVLAGELGRLDGIPVVVSEWQREVLNASGVYESGQTKTAIDLVYRNGFAIGDRKQGDVKILRELYAEYGQIAMLARERVDFEAIYPIASNRTVNLGINVG